MKRKAWAFLTALAVCISSMNLNVLAEGNSAVMEEQTEKGTNVDTVSVGDSMEVQSTSQQEEYVLPFYEERDNVAIEFKVVNEWEGGYQAEIVLTNTGTEYVENWQIDFNSDDDITNIWNTNVIKNEKGECSVSAMEYNSNIAPGTNVSIGYQTEGSSYTVRDLNINVSMEEAEEENQKESGTAHTGTYVYEYENFSVEYIVQNSWVENCNVCVKITNTSDTAIENWKLVWESEDVLSNVYNADITCENNMYTAKNIGYNQDIAAGETLEFGFDVCYGDSLDIPTGFAMPDKAQTVITEGYAMESVVTNVWDSGYTGEIRLTNTGNTVFEDWHLTLQSEDKITNIWIGTLTDLGNGMYEIKNPDHAQNLQPGETIVIGYQAEGTTQDSLTAVMLCVYEEDADGATDDKEEGDTEGKEDIPGGDDPENGDSGEGDSEPLKDKYIEVQTVFEEPFMDTAYYVEKEITSYYGIVNNLSFVKYVDYRIDDVFGSTVKTGSVAYNTETGAWTIEDFGLVIGWNDVVFCITLEDDTVVEEIHSYMNSSEENMEKTDIGLQDTDGDGICDYFESVYGTDKDKADSDGDGLSDLEEIFSGTDPAVQDADDDVDEDGLTVTEELAYGTSPLYPDSDLDGIDDKAEVMEVGTDPTKEDTDGDGLTDGEEIKLGTNPLVSDSDGDGVVDSEEKIEQKVSCTWEEETGAVSEVTVRLACSGDIEHQVFVENTMGKDELSSNVVGLVGVPVEINSMTPFDEAEITFRYDREKLGEAKEENLCIMWYDEDNMTYVMLEDSVIDTQSQTVSVTTTHFSTYLLIDKEIWLDAWRSEIDYDEIKPEDIQSTYDIYICLDYSVNEEELELEKEFVRKIVDQMVEGDRVIFGGVSSMSQRKYYSAPMSDKQSVLNTLDCFEENILSQFNVTITADGTYRADCYEVMRLFANMADRTNSTNACVGFFVNAGKNEDNKSLYSLYSKETAKADLAKLGFPVHSVSITTQVNEELTSVLSEYGGKGFNITTCDEIIGKYGSSSDTLDMLDTDGDGLYDTYEINGLRIQNGTVMYTDPYSVDTDGDGISDYAEIGGLPVKVVWHGRGKEFVATINYQVSDPNDVNSTGKKLDTANYMVVDNFDYLPYNQSTYEAIFIKNTNKLDANGEWIYGLYNIYNSNPDELSIFEIAVIASLVETQCYMLKSMGIFPDANKLLLQYIGNKEDRYFYSCDNIMKNNKQTREIWAEDMWHLMVAAEEYLQENQTAIIAQTPSNEGNGVIYQAMNKFEGEVPDYEIELKYFFAIRMAKTREVAEISYDGKFYTMKLRYYLFDYYDWDEAQDRKIGTVSDKDLYKMCRCGNSKFYENWWLYETLLIWEGNDESRNNAINEEKKKMQKW